MPAGYRFFGSAVISLSSAAVVENSETEGDLIPSATGDTVRNKNPQTIVVRTGNKEVSLDDSYWKCTAEMLELFGDGRK